MGNEATGWAMQLAWSAFAIYGALYVTTAIATPTFFLEFLAVNRKGDRPGRLRWYVWPLVILSAISVAVLIHAALYPAVAIIPYSWGNHDDEGTWTSSRDLMRMLGAVIGGIGIMGKLEKNAEIVLYGPVERKARNVLVDAIARGPSSSLPKIREHVEDKLGDDRDDRNPATFATRNYIREQILSYLSNR